MNIDKFVCENCKQTEVLRMSDDAEIGKFDGSKTVLTIVQIRALRESLRAIKGIRKEIEKKINGFEAKSDVVFKVIGVNRPVKISVIYDTLYAFYKSENINRELHDKKTMEDIFVYMKLNHDDILSEKLLEENMRERNKFVSEVRKNFEIDDRIDFKSVKNFCGLYKFYRPFFLNPHNQVMISCLEIGSGDDYFSVKLNSKYVDNRNVNRYDALCGKLIPVQENKMMLMLGDLTGIVAMSIDEVVKDSDASVISLQGTFLSAIAARSSSAYPFYADRATESFDCEVKSRDADEIPEDFHALVRRGFVDYVERPNTEQTGTRRDRGLTHG